MTRDRALEGCIAADPDAVEPYLVYADWLSERGDPRGEWIRLQVLDAPGADTWFARHSEVLVGPLALWMRSASDPRPLTWSRGFVSEARLAGGFPLADPVRALLESPAGAVVRSLELFEDTRPSRATGLVDAVARYAPRTLARLRVGSHGSALAPIDAEGWGALLGGRSIHALAWSGIDAGALGALARAAGVGAIRSLDIAPANRAPDPAWRVEPDAAWWAAVRAVVQALPALEQLHLVGNRQSGESQVLARERPDLRVRWSSWRGTDPRTLHHVIAFAPGERVACPHCASHVPRLRVDNDRLICEACGRSFEPPPAVAARLGIEGRGRRW